MKDWIALVLGGVALMVSGVCGPTLAEQENAALAADVRKAVEACFSPPDGAKVKASISAVFKPDGFLATMPEVIAKGIAPADEAYAAAAVRAIVRCEPNLATLHLQGRMVLNFDPSGSATEDTVSEGLLPDRLKAMRDAAAKLTALADAHSKAGKPLPPSGSDAAPLLAILCNPEEAERLNTGSSEDYKAISQYVQQVSQVMEVYNSPAATRSQTLVNSNMKSLGTCLDAVIWSGQAAFGMTETLLAANPDLADNADAKRILDRSRSNIAVVIDGAFEAFRLDGIGSNWCIARMRPLISLTQAAAATMSASDRQTLLRDAKLAETCGPEMAQAMQPIYRSLSN